MRGKRLQNGRSAWQRRPTWHRCPVWPLLSWGGWAAVLMLNGCWGPSAVGDEPVPIVDRQLHEISRQATRTAEAVGAPEAALWQDVAQQVDHLSRFRSPGTVQRLAKSLARLSENRQDDAELDRIRRQFRGANLVVWLDDAQVNKWLAVDESTVQPIDEDLLGTHLLGTGWTTTRVTPTLLPTDGGIRLRLSVLANTRSRTVGYNGAARVDSAGRTFVEAEKEIELGPSGWNATPTTTRGHTNTSMLDFQWDRHLGKKLARAAAVKRKRESEVESNRRAQGRVRSAVDARVGTQVPRLYAAATRLWQDIQTRYGTLLSDADLRSTGQGVEAAAVIASPTQLTTRWAHPRRTGSDDIVVQFHESLLNNLLERRLGGRTLAEDDWSGEFDLALLRRGLATSDPDRQWTIHFEQLRPIVIRFDQGRLTVGIRATQFQLGNRSYPAARVAAHYRLESGTSAGLWVRDSRLDVDVLAGADQTIGVRQQVFRSLLRQRFEDVFPQQWSLAEMLPPENNSLSSTASLGPLKLQSATPSREWLSLGFTAARADSRADDSPAKAIGN